MPLLDPDEEELPKQPPEWKWWVDTIIKVLQLAALIYALHKGEQIVINLASRGQMFGPEPKLASPAALPSARRN